MYDCERVLVVHPFVHFCVCPFSHLKVVPRLLSTVQCCLCLRELLLESVNVGVLASRRLHGMLAQMLALLQLLQRPLQPLHLDILQQVKRVCMSVRVSRGARHGCPKEKKDAPSHQVLADSEASPQRQSQPFDQSPCSHSGRHAGDFGASMRMRNEACAGSAAVAAVLVAGGVEADPVLERLSAGTVHEGIAHHTARRRGSARGSARGSVWGRGMRVGEWGEGASLRIRPG